MRAPRLQIVDPGLFSLKHAARAAIVMPAVVAFADKVIQDQQTTFLSAFGSMAILVFADFGGPPRKRLTAYLGLTVAGAALITLGLGSQAMAATNVEYSPSPFSTTASLSDQTDDADAIVVSVAGNTVTFADTGVGGINTADDIRMLREAGCDAFLIGEAFMRSEKPGNALRELMIRSLN